ncbi:MAG: hypothetical protein AAF462_11555 [Thermodesulfobacteriota bacterium]
MKYIGVLLYLILVFSFGVDKVAALDCLPTCSAVDNEFLEVPGNGLSTIGGAQITVVLVSTGENFEFGIFDGDARMQFDPVVGSEDVQIKLELHADPLGDGSGLAGPVIALWTSDGSDGLNTGEPMLDNDWSDFTFPNDPSALNANGEYVYTLFITPLSPTLGTSISNLFKLRTPGIMYVPAGIPVSFAAAINSETPELSVELLMLIYPNITCDNPACTMICGGFTPTSLCDYRDPSCCLHETTYDGIWNFFMEVPDGETALDIWDGDFDHGDENSPVFDTDDPNTPGFPFLPPWTAGTEAISETANISQPNDDNGPPTGSVVVRTPNIFYSVIDPLGNSYQNNNPSGDREWELFRLDTLTSDPSIADVQVPSIPAGLWEIRIEGVDMSNLNALVLPFDMRGERIGEPITARNVPTLNKWGIIAIATFMLIASLIYFRRRHSIK